MRALKDMLLAVLIGILGGVLVTTCSYYHDHKQGGVEQTLRAISGSMETMANAFGAPEKEAYDEILRFHVRANSDGAEDQAVKLKVKDRVLEYLNPLLKECKSKEESKEVLLEQLPEIDRVAEEVLKEACFDYGVEAYLTKEVFPEKTYGDLTFPEGEYEALRIDLGQANGKNWWCVMYPSLCITQGAVVIVDETGKEQLKKVLTTEEYEALLYKPDREFQMESYFLDWWKEWRDR